MKINDNRPLKGETKMQGHLYILLRSNFIIFTIMKGKKAGKFERSSATYVEADQPTRTENKLLIMRKKLTDWLTD